MVREYHLSGMASSTIANMKRSRTYRRQSTTFGPWLLARLKDAGLTQGEFAERVGVSPTTVSRWVNGRVPDGSFIDQIADVLVLDYDLVSMQAGYRPRLSIDQIERFRRIAEPYARKIDWEDDDNVIEIRYALDHIIRIQERRSGKRSVDQWHDPVEVEEE